MNFLKSSWSAFAPERAKIYLDGFGHPSERSKTLAATLLNQMFGGAPFKLADFGCGNGHLHAFFKQAGLAAEYFGYDFSDSLLDAARARYSSDASAHFSEADIEDAASIAERCDVVLFSHVLEMLESPQKALLCARTVAPVVMIRFFEPPEGECDITELRSLDVGTGESVPYLRRTISRDYYNLILSKAGCTSVEVHQVEGDKDQVHVLRFDR